MFNLSYAHFANAYRRFAGLDKNSLFVSLGWEDVAGGTGYVRNGAVLTSLALLSAGVSLSGNLRVASGALQGGKVFNGANRLAEWLSERFGEPEVFAFDSGPGDVAYRLFGRRGILSFIEPGGGPRGGEIGLLDGRNASALCCAAGIHHPSEACFWELH
ncbi:MAG: type VI secretion system amidase effector protein Tae4 [Azonexaceae bacterium]|nr:type VI secretion system amidase effector protein Tae4 [Azonexaceae bacterium]